MNEWIKWWAYLGKNKNKFQNIQEHDYLYT
jgi:hypothetical protein